MILISFLFGIVAITNITFFIFKDLKISFFLITLFLITSPIQFFAFTQASFIKYYLIFILFLPLLLNFSNKHKLREYLLDKLNNFKLNLKKNKKKEIGTFLFSFFLTLLITFKFLPFNWRFEAHDMLYLSWLNDIFNVDYSGSIRIPTAYPQNLSANHLASGYILSPFLLFSKSINLFKTLSIKYLLIFISLFDFFRIYLSKIVSYKFKKFISYFSFILLIFMFYMVEIDYSLSISNYPLIILLISLGAYILQENKYNILFSPYLSTVLLTSKASTLPAFFVTYFVFVILYRKNFISLFRESKYKISYYISSLVFFLTFLGWIIPKSNFGSLAISSPFCLISSTEPLKCLGAILRNPFGLGIFVDTDLRINWISNIFNFINNDFIIFFYIWILVILPCILSAIFLKKLSQNKLSEIFADFVLIYGIIASLSVLFLRESVNYSGKHSSHIFLIIPILTILSLTLVIANNDVFKIGYYKFISIIMILSIILNNFNHSIYKERISVMNNSNFDTYNNLSITYLESKKFDENYCTKDEKIKSLFGNYLDEKGCGDGDLGEILDALNSRRSKSTIYAKKSILKSFILKN